eukprot:gene1203-4415_t
MVSLLIHELRQGKIRYAEIQSRARCAWEDNIKLQNIKTRSIHSSREAIICIDVDRDDEFAIVSQKQRMTIFNMQPLVKNLCRTPSNTLEPSFYLCNSRQRQSIHHNIMPTNIPEMASINPKCSVNTVKWYPQDRTMFTSSGPNGITVWDTDKMQQVETFSNVQYVTHHDQSPIASGKQLIAAASQGHVILCDLVTGMQSHRLSFDKSDKMTFVCWSPAKEFLLASGTSKGRVMIWDIRRAKPCLALLDRHNNKQASSLMKMAHEGHPVLAGSFTSDGEHLITAGDRLRLWDMRFFTNTHTLYNGNVSKTSHSVGITNYHGRGRVYNINKQGSTINAHDIFSGNFLQSYQGPLSTVTSLVVGHNGNPPMLLAGTTSGDLVAWSAPIHTQMNAFINMERAQRRISRIIRMKRKNSTANNVYSAKKENGVHQIGDQNVSHLDFCTSSDVFVNRQSRHVCQRAYLSTQPHSYSEEHSVKALQCKDKVNGDCIDRSATICDISLDSPGVSTHLTSCCSSSFRSSVTNFQSQVADYSLRSEVSGPSKRPKAPYFVPLQGAEPPHTSSQNTSFGDGGTLPINDQDDWSASDDDNDTNITGDRRL